MNDESTEGDDDLQRKKAVPHVRKGSNWGFLIKTARKHFDDSRDSIATKIKLSFGPGIIVQFELFMLL